MPPVEVSPQHRLDIRDALLHALADGGFALDKVPEYTLHLIEAQAWLPEFQSLRDLVESRVLDGGFNSDVARLVKLCAGTPAEVPLREALKGKPGRPKAGEEPGHNITQKGTSRAYTLSRLQRERPDLADHVDAGDLTPNAAAVRAGFRKPTATVPIDTVDSAVRALLRRFSSADIRVALDRAEP